MKKLLVCFILVNISILTYCQKEFAPIGATWYYSKVENFAGEEGYVKIVSESDTVIEGKKSKILSQKYYNTSSGHKTYSQPRNPLRFIPPTVYLQACSSLKFNNN
jgi:hypothetical protein